MLGFILTMLMGCSSTKIKAQAVKKCESWSYSIKSENACLYGVDAAGKGNARERSKWYCKTYQSENVKACYAGVDYYYDLKEGKISFNSINQKSNIGEINTKESSMAKEEREAVEMDSTEIIMESQISSHKV